MTPTGPDPALSVPAVQQAPIGETVVVPVNVGLRDGRRKVAA